MPYFNTAGWSVYLRKDACAVTTFTATALSLPLMQNFVWWHREFRTSYRFTIQPYLLTVHTRKHRCLFKTQTNWPACNQFTCKQMHSNQAKGICKASITAANLISAWNLVKCSLVDLDCQARGVHEGRFAHTPVVKEIIMLWKMIVPIRMSSFT